MQSHHSNYGMALKDAGKQDEAIRELLTALDPEVKDTEEGLLRQIILGLYIWIKRTIRMQKNGFLKLFTMILRMEGRITILGLFIL